MARRSLSSGLARGRAVTIQYCGRVNHSGRWYNSRYSVAIQSDRLAPIDQAPADLTAKLLMTAE